MDGIIVYFHSYNYTFFYIKKHISFLRIFKIIHLLALSIKRVKNGEFFIVECGIRTRLMTSKENFEKKINHEIGRYFQDNH